MTASAKQTKVVVNGMEWDDDPRREERPCRGCEVPTRGVLKDEPWCIACAMEEVMKRLMKPLKEALR